MEDFIVVLVNGTGTSGKDEFVKYCAEHATVYNMSTIDLPKEAATLLGWKGDSADKSPKARKFLSDIKDAWVEFNDGSYHNILRRVDMILNDPIECIEPGDIPIIFVHCREPEEIVKFKRHFGHRATTLLIRRPGIVEEQINHADLNVEHYPYAFYVENEGTLVDLAKKAEEFVTIVWGLLK